MHEEGAGGKTCTKCGVWKHFSEFHKSSHHGFGYRSDCKECKKKRDLEYQSARREKYAENTRKWRGENPDKNYEWVMANREATRERQRAYAKKRYWSDPEYRARVNKATAASRKKRRENDPEYAEKERQRFRDNYAKNREKYLGYQRDYRAKKKAENNRGQEVQKVQEGETP